MDKNERRICWYSSLLIALMMNSAKLLALRENGVVARYWHFNLAELSFQAGFNLLFCYLMFYLNLQRSSRIAICRQQKRLILYYAANAFVIAGTAILSISLQFSLFADSSLRRFFWPGHFGRFLLSTVLIGIVVKIILLLREGKEKEIAHEHLKSAYMAAELELLKEQMNPHFLFNALSSLSGVIREDPDLAQKYLRELSNVFRYAITHAKVNLVSLDEELTMLQSFAQLITMRLEDAFELDVDIPSQMRNLKLPHLSLQPLLENAVKHNAATRKKPLRVRIYMESMVGEGLVGSGEYLVGTSESLGSRGEAASDTVSSGFAAQQQPAKLVITNNIRQIPAPESSNGLGLANLNERFKIMMQSEIEISKTHEYFTVKLPLTT
ncbi:sensor histidine kinase [Mucilaginibacter paludis]|uniref:Signal transduction histidine kinase n=1 Tax=Mucilaginibacter paludis DSM 18603 TaxID=714943 RepID=H1YCX1_9SPHI|nr:histidine kinase [Mucilaginibacter paludis]EHQ25142.1 putative signal transduction histidine kinase [Mucilaginibacter paludis DSM 18603]